MQVASDEWEKTYMDSTKKNEEKFSFLTEEWEENLISAIHNACFSFVVFVVLND
jgi:hypothetical protein